MALPPPTREAASRPCARSAFALPSLSQIVVVPLSTSIRGLPHEVVLTTAEGMRAASTLKVEWIRAVDRRHVGPAFGSLPEQRWREVRDALLFVLGLDSLDEL